jgi:hypothetical protein
MYASVRYNRSISYSLNYNELKLSQGKAELLLAENFLKDPERLSREDKLNRFARLHVLNDAAKANTLHISLSFHPSDLLDNQRMMALSRYYMEKLDLAHLPWLGYRHKDTGHPHLHIVGTLIERDGNRFKLDDILRYKSLRLTREMEKEFSLVKMYDPEALIKHRLTDGLARKVIYGEPGRKEAVELVLDHVVNRYRYASMEELNAVLRLYNVRARIAWDKQDLNKPKGLMYTTLDEKGHLIGKAFKSSSFESQPTLKKLEERFALNRGLEKEQLNKLALSIEWAFAGKSVNWEVFRKNLLKEKIHAVPEREKPGVWRDMYYVDVGSRAVFKGEALGEKYGWPSLFLRLTGQRQLKLEQSLQLSNQLTNQHKLKLRL